LGLGVALVGLAGLIACGADASARNAETTIDSIVPRDVALARFREGTPEVTELTGGASSRNALVRRFVRALTAGDTATLSSLTLTRAEFAWLYYPTTPQGLPPYDLAPGLMWSMLDMNGHRGLSAALDAYRGRVTRYVGHSCDTVVSRERANTVYGPCTVRLAVDHDTVQERLFGAIISRGGRFKFVSLANKLD
jgi:hypothetical protein